MRDPGSQRPSTTPRACPFVAFDDDRDRRGDRPDPRHRCFAVPNPEPRALAHQEAYCLSPAFSSCSFFLDWAARAAADPVGGAAGGLPLPAAAVASSSESSAAEDAYNPAALDPVGRSWATPPPWVGEPAMKSTHPTDAGGPEQLMAVPQPPEPVIDHDLGSPEPPPPASVAALAPASIPIEAAAVASSEPPGPMLTEPQPPAEWQPPIEPPGERVPPPVFPAVMPASRNETWSKPSGAPGAALDDLEPAIPDAGTAQPQDGGSGRAVDAGRSPRISLQSRPPSAGKPEWKGGKRPSTFAAVRGRPRISPLVIGFFALLVGALVLFLLPSFLAGGSGKTPRPSPSVVAGTPTPVPTATPKSYTVKSGDTLGQIANKFGLTVDQLACYNNIRNPNSVSVGQQVLIPPTDYECPARTPKPKPSK